MKATLTCLLLSLISLTSLHAADEKNVPQLKYEGGLFSFSAEQNQPPESQTKTAATASKNLFSPLNPAPIEPAKHASKENPVVDVDPHSIAILMADGSEKVVRAIMRPSFHEIRVMTSDGITGIAFKSLHPKTQAYFKPIIEEDSKYRELAEAREQAAAESYRANQAIKERIDADLNRTIAARQAADEAQAVARAKAIREANDYRASLSVAAFDAETERRAIATAKRIEQARIAYQQQLQAQELQIFNALVEVQQIEVLRRLGYLK